MTEEKQVSKSELKKLGQKMKFDVWDLKRLYWDVHGCSDLSIERIEEVLE
jgi:hypothetical protein